MTLKDRERLWQTCCHRVFYLFQASLFKLWLLLRWQFYFDFLPFDLGILLLAEGFVCYRAAWIIGLALYGLTSFLLCFAFERWRFLFLCAFHLCCVHYFAKSGFTSELELLSITPFSLPDVYFPSCFPSCYFPLFLQCILGSRTWSQMPRMR